MGKGEVYKDESVNNVIGVSLMVFIQFSYHQRLPLQ